MQPSDITIISVCFNSGSVLQEMLDSVHKNSPVILVDNASTDRASIQSLAEKSGATLLQNKKNLGFGSACNQGAAAARTELLLFLNPDARLSTGATAALLKAVKEHQSAVAFNPKLVSSNGNQQFKRRSKLIPRAEWMPRGWPESDREVSVLSGAALLVRASDFAAVGGFDPNIFLYHEDDDLSVRLSAERGSLIFVRDAEVTHLEGRSNTRSASSARFKAYHLARSAIYASRKHGRPMPVILTLLEATKNMASIQNLFSKRKRAKNIGFLRGALSMISNAPGDLNDT